MIYFLSQFKLFFQLLFLIFITALVVYFVPAVYNRLLFLLLFIPVWKSKNDYFWFAYLIILLEAPGGLFSGSSRDEVTRLPIYTFAPNVSTSFVQLFILLFLIKGFFKNQWYRYKSFVYKKEYSYIGILWIILFIVSLMIGMPKNYFIYIFKILVALSFYVSTIFIFKNEENIINFFKMIFPFVFITIMLQLYSILNHHQLIAEFNPLITVTQGVFTDEVTRPIETGIVLFICFFGSLLYLGNMRHIFSDKYLLLINIVSYISIIMSGSRGWFLGFTLMYFFYLYLNYKRIGKNIIAIVTAIGFFLIIPFLIPPIAKQINMSSKRLATIQIFASGDITAGGTLSRLSERGPRVMEGFKKSTIIFGAGYTDLYFEYTDGHVGFQNILLHSGVIGFVIFISFALTLFFTPLKILRKFNVPFGLQSIIRNLPLFIPSLMVINSGTQFWGFDIPEIQRIMLLAAYITISSVYIKISKYSTISNIKTSI